MKKRNNKIIVLIITAIIFAVALLIFILNYSKDDTSLSILEKKWINDNQNNIIDVSVFNDVSIFGKNGDGVIFDYLDNFNLEYGINFNKISYLYSGDKNYRDLSFKILKSDESITSDDVLLYEDRYVLVSKENIKYDKVTDIDSITLGVFDDDLLLANYYLSGAENVSYKSYVDIEHMVIDINANIINYMLIPMNQYLAEILENDLNIVYHVNDISRKYVIEVKNNDYLFEIIRKYTIKYNSDYFEEIYKKNFVSTVFNSKQISDAEKMSYNANSYVYGYVTNIPYEKKADDLFEGTISHYLSDFEDLFDIDFKTVKYDDIASLKQAFSNGEVDLIFDNFDTLGVNIDIISTISLFNEKYVILSKNSNYLSSIRSLKDIEVKAVSGTYLFSYLNTNGIKAVGYSDTNELLRNIDSNSIIAMDYDTYFYYRNQKLSDYNVIYDDELDSDYKFMIRDVNKNNTFATLFDFYVTTVNYNNIKYDYNISEKYISANIGKILKIIFIFILLVLLCGIAIVLVKKIKNKEKILKKEEKIKFIDVMTSLKNRNYLNYNINKWEDNVIYPQAFVVIDLNKIKYVNDNHGHEEGDNVIKKAASILIINQLENTDIMRTDGNEFLVYMVGYSEKDVVQYTRKIYKELKELPYGFGASVGYSMILDDVKTIDDAINEATIEMRKSKDNEYNAGQN